MAEKVTAGPITSANGVREAVCIHTSTAEEVEPNTKPQQSITPAAVAWYRGLITSKSEASKFESYTPRKTPEEPPTLSRCSNALKPS